MGSIEEHKEALAKAAAETGEAVPELTNAEAAKMFAESAAALARAAMYLGIADNPGALAALPSIDKR